jgi:hypothetical protein
VPVLESQLLITLVSAQLVTILLLPYLLVMKPVLTFKDPMMVPVTFVTTCVKLVITVTLVLPVKPVITELWIPILVIVKPDTLITVLLLVKNVCVLVPLVLMLPLVSPVKLDSNLTETINADAQWDNTKTDVPA